MPLLETKGAASAQGFGGAGAGASGLVTYIEDVFSTYLYTGNSSTQTITNGIDLSGKGGLVWIKSRSNATDHALYDTIRGATKDLVSNSTAAETTQSTGLTAFNGTGFSIGALAKLNTNAATYASWTFREQPKFFDVVTYTGNSADGRFISHSLGSTPGMVIIKNLTSTYDWVVWHRSLANPSKYLVLNSTAATATDIYGPFGSYDGGFTTNASCFTSTGFYVAADARSNLNANNYVAYVFAHDAGGFGLTGSDNVITCGSCSVGDTINLGYEPQWLLMKRTDAAVNWFLLDSMRGLGADSSSSRVLNPNTSAAESGLGAMSITSTGFICDANGSYIYIAIRRGPMKVPTSGTSVYNAITWSGNNTTGRTLSHGLSSPPDLSIIQWTNGLQENLLWDKLRSLSTTAAVDSIYLRTPSTGGDGPIANYYYIPDMTNVAFGSVASGSTQINNTSSTMVGWNFRRAPSFCDVVCYTGTGSATTQTHNLGVAPELMIVKSRSSSVYDWRAYSATLGATQYLTPNTTQSGAASSTSWNDTAPTASVFTVGSSAVVNGSGGTYVAYLFATCAGVSKVGSYTGTGALQTVNCGFTGGARFVLIKRTDSTGDWYVYDSARGISSSSDPYLLLNSSAAEVTGTNYVDTDSTGFKVTAAAPAGLNANGGSFVFLAIA